MSLNDQALAAHMEHLDEEPEGIQCEHYNCCGNDATYILITRDVHPITVFPISKSDCLCQDCAIEALKDMKPNQEIVKL